MNFSNFPFYFSWDNYLQFLNDNFASLILSDDIKFLGFIILNIALVFGIIFVFKIIKFVVLLGKNIIFR